MWGYSCEAVLEHKPSQGQFRVSHSFGGVVDGSALLHALPTTRAAAAHGLISQPGRGLHAWLEQFRPSWWCRTWAHSFWDRAEDTRSLQRCHSGTCKMKRVPHCRCSCYHFSQPSLLSCRHPTWFNEFFSWPISEPAQIGIIKIPRNVPIQRHFSTGSNLLPVKSQLPILRILRFLCS